MGEYATARPAGHNIKECNLWVCIYGPWICCALRASSQSMAIASAQKGAPEMKRLCKVASFPRATQAFQNCPSYLGKRERTDCPFGGRNEGDALASLLRSCGQNLDIVSSFTIIKYVSYSPVLPGCVGLFLRGRSSSPRSAYELQRLIPTLCLTFSLMVFWPVYLF